jgi:hypothetical protein
MLCFLTLVPISLGMAARAANAGEPLPCNANCAPTGVAFLEQGSYPLSNTVLCGVGSVPDNQTLADLAGWTTGSYNPLAAVGVDKKYDDPAKLGPTSEGNYTDSEAFQFTPATGLQANDKVTVTLPQPGSSGSVLPPAQVPSGAPDEATNSYVVMNGGTGTPPNPPNGIGQWDVVVQLKDVPGSSAPQVRLDAFNPYDPPTPAHAPGSTSAFNNTSASIAGFDSTTNQYDLGSTVTATGSGGSYTAQFQLTDTTPENVVVAATDVTNNVGIAKDLTLQFGGGSTPTGKNCSSDPSGTPPSAGDGFTYLLIENGVGYAVPNVSVTSSASFESAVLTVPSDFPSDTTSPPAQVTVEVLDAVSPPGEGTPNVNVSAYPSNDFSITTSQDPVPGYPANAPLLQADASGALANITTFGHPTYPVDPYASSLSASAPSAPVSAPGGTSGGALTASATLRDHYGNPVNDKQVSIFAPGSHAVITPASASTGYPTTASDGSVTYDVADSCAETVNLQATDLNDNVTLLTNPSYNSPVATVPVTFTAGPSAYPDQTQTPTSCGFSTSKSQISVSVDKVPSLPVGAVAPAPADGKTNAVVTVTLADQFGNVDSCHQVVLASVTPGSSAVVTPVAPSTADACNNQDLPGYTGQDGIATFDVTDSTPETVVLGVTDTTNFSAWPVDPSAHPLDVAQVKFEPADKQMSTLTASPAPPTAAPADGQPAATVTATVEDAAGQPEVGKSVSLAACSPNLSPCQADPTTSISPVSAQTDPNGQFTFDVGDSAQETPYFQATVPSDAVTISQTASVMFKPGGASLTTSATEVLADGIGTAKVTFGLTDTNNSPLSQIPVTLKPSDSTSVISPSTGAMTGPDGKVSFIVKDTAPGPVTFTATASWDTTSGPACVGVGLVSGTNCTVTASVNVQFLSAPNTFSLSANPTSDIPADGGSSSQVTVKALDSGGVPVAGIPVSLLAKGSKGGTPVVSPTSAITASDGVATFSVTDTTVETVTAIAVYDEVSPPGAPGPAAGSLTQKTPFQGEVLAGNAFSDQLQVTGATGTVTYTPTPGSDIAVSSSGQASAASSLATGTYSASGTDADTSNHTGTWNYLLNVLQPAPGCAGAGAPATCSAAIGFIETEAEASSVSAAPGSAPADGYSSVLVTVALSTGSGAPINGHSVTLNTGSPTALVTAPTGDVGALTGVNGQQAGEVVFTITDTRVENLTIYARDLTTGVIVNETTTVNFTPTEAGLSSVTAGPPSSVAASGPPGSPNKIDVTVKISMPATAPPGCPTSVAGHNIQLNSSSGTASISAPMATDATGTASFTVSDPVVETIVLTAADTTCNVLISQTTTASFTASESNQSTVVANPASTPAEGPPATLTVTLLSASGAPISGRTVTVPSVSHATVTALASPGLSPGETNSNGVAQFSVSDNTVETVTLAASDGGTPLDQVATTRFTANEANQSTISASPCVSSPPCSVPAGGPTTTVTVTLVKGGGAFIVGDNVSLSASSSTASVSPVLPTTNGSGQATFTVSDSAPETITLSALDTTTGVAVGQTFKVSFFKNEQNQSTASASPTALKVKKSSTITVTLLSSTGTALAGHAVTLNTGSTTTTVTMLTKGGVTNAAGQIQLSVTDSVSQVLSITVTDTTFGVTLYKPVALTFTKA